MSACGQLAAEETLGSLEVVHAEDGGTLYRQDRYRGGQDWRRRPYALFRTPIDAGPVRLR